MAEARAIDGRKRSDAARLLLAAARERFAAAATDLLLPDIARLSEWQRLTAANLLSRLVGSVEDELRSGLAARFAENDALFAALSSARVPIALPILERAQALRDSELMMVLVRRVEEHHFWRGRPEPEGKDLLESLLVDDDDEVAADAMELLVARSRRFDRFDDPLLGRVELPADLQHRLVWLVAAALRHYIVQQHHVTAVDAAVEEVASATIASYDEGRSLEALSMRLSYRLHVTGRLDGAMLASMIGNGLLPLFLAGLAVTCRLDPAAAWEVLADPRGRGPALLVRAADVDRREAAAIFLALNSRGPFFSSAEGDAAAAQLDLYDTLDTASAIDVLRLWQAHPAYRASVARLSTRSRGSAGTMEAA